MWQNHINLGLSVKSLYLCFLLTSHIINTPAKKNAVYTATAIEKSTLIIFARKVDFDGLPFILGKLRFLYGKVAADITAGQQVNFQVP